MAEARGITPREMEQELLHAGQIPLRYIRNMEAVSQEEQLLLLDAAIGVCGCGGLGLYVINHLARLGVGHITVWDSDVFSESNLNRQLWSDLENLGKSKAEVCRQLIRTINPAVEIEVIRSRWEESQGEKFRWQQVIVDALDDISSRLRLAEACEEMGLPLVHAAVGGWYGQVTVIMPGDPTMVDLYGGNLGKGLEEEQGTLSFTAAIAASVQASEAIKLVLGRDSELRRKICMIDLLEPEFIFMNKCNKSVT